VSYKNSTTILALFVLAVVAAHAARADVNKGAQIAGQWCANCHLIGDERSGPIPQGPPSFRTIAKSGLTADQLRAFLSNPHGAMPNLSLTRSEIDDLVDYIAALR